ncbi:ABC transporter ATP-binding protein [Bacillus smithii]|uniref:ABC transporter ATP-binding protein n=1 Tax=Bacillus smithii TaxID=1479 RepID=UPI003D1E4799
MADIRFEHVSKVYHGGIEAVRDFSLHISDQEFLVIVGPSGSGKSTVLRMAAGLEDITKGNLYLGGKLINNIPPKDRDLAMVFQHYALYPHMTVYGNMAFSLKLQKLPKSEIDQRVRWAADVLGLKEKLDRKPRELSGGERQRVALGRAIVRQPQAFLFDEPLSNLDAMLRVQMRNEIKKLHQQLKTTSIYVTHDQVEAMTLGTRLVVMKEGEIQQVGTPQEVYENPANQFVGEFIGSPAMNFFVGRLENGFFQIGDLFFKLPEQKASFLKARGYDLQTVLLGIRPEHIIAFSEGVTDSATVVAKIQLVEFMGAETILSFLVGGQPCLAKVPSDKGWKAGEQAAFRFQLEKSCFFDAKTKWRIDKAGS